jgi:hypothetical protein
MARDEDLLPAARENLADSSFRAFERLMKTRTAFIRID